ncbi:DUF2235 domain-containing protein [Reyranella sp.]|uniref:phospholipase effector Tle1 domain-containing protein n=1 Tax=Reyranella sp. TaxID=1929291 RepID=UPI00121BC670|nr:DUF2235 domain-containing protein [Reyranella sp.]TAJ82085.1 MAG: LysM peptidoglycan-binding domain-containing protein [Reyranella sp.]
MKRLVICFDGTWNRLDAPYPTNVVITAESVLPQASDGTAQAIFYDEGIGTGKWEKYTGGIFGAGMVENLGDAYRFLIFNHTPGDQIYVFGFSRGAYTARSFAGMLSTCGLLQRSDASKVTEAIERYQNRKGDSTAFAAEMMAFRSNYSPALCVSDEDEAWRCANVKGYTAGQSGRLKIDYLGVWDSVGALGIPARYKLLAFLNRQHQFHDTRLSPFIKSARHAVAIDEHRRDFLPTLWDNVAELNVGVGADEKADDAPYQQRWFPGVHGAVGGGGERRGLSDQALDWVLDGARKCGLEFDGVPQSRIFELSPDYKDHLQNALPVARPGIISRIMDLLPKVDRVPGPKLLHEVSISARRRWLDKPENLKDKTAYKPKTLANVSAILSGLDAQTLGVGVEPPTEILAIHRVVPGDGLNAIAMQYYNDHTKAPDIFKANLDKLEHPDRIYVGQSLRIPRLGR